MRKNLKLKIILAASLQAANFCLAGPIDFINQTEQKTDTVDIEKTEVAPVQNKASAQTTTSEPAKQASKKSLPIASPVGLGEINKHSVGFGLGQTFLAGDFDRDGTDSITLDAFYDYSASHSFDMYANLHYSKHDFQNREVILPGLALGIKGKFVQFDSFSPYVQGGLGFYRPKVKRIVDNALVESEGKVTFGLNLGAGVELRLNENFKFGILASLHNPFDIKQDLGTDIEGSYSKLLLTGFYTFN
jgi:hypothetical protein